jgi:hypothetical protein
MLARSVGLSLVLLALLVAPGGAGIVKLPYGPGPKAHYTVQPQPRGGSCHYRYTASGQPLPDVHCTRGALNPKVSEATLASTICKSGYTSSIRPPESVTEPEKIANARSYGYTGPLGEAEYDHLVSLELGGDPNDSRNLWVEPPSPGHKASSGVSNPKDAVESQAKSLVCSHRVSLRAMQLAIATNWTTAISVVTHVKPTHPPAGGHISCTARVSNAHPAQYSTVSVYTSTSPGATVVATAHYKSKDTSHTATADSAGAATVDFEISRATVGYTVRVSITASIGGDHASCSSAFTPQ